MNQSKPDHDVADTGALGMFALLDRSLLRSCGDAHLGRQALRRVALEG